MEFLAPLMLLGTLGVAVPVIIHLIGRRRAKVVRFAAMEFLLSSRRKTAPRLRLRELLLLAIRILICLAVPLALAKPFTACEASGPMVERGPQAAVLIIDNSFASGYQLGDSSLLTRAKQQAASIIAQLGPEAEIAVLLAAEGSDSPTELSRDHLLLSDTVRGVRASARPAATTTALRRAAQLLSASPHDRRTVFLLSPLAATGFRPDEVAWPEGQGPELRIIDLFDRDLPTERNPPNVALTNLTVERDPGAGSRGVRVTAEVANFGQEPVNRHEIHLRIGDEIVARGEMSLRPQERQSKQFMAALPPGNRFADVIVEIAADALAIDNRRFVRTELREEVRVLLINGDPHTVRYEDELFYVQAALRPGDRADSGTVLTTVMVDELPKLSLDDYDVAVLANVRALSAERVSKLSDWVKRGGGLFVAVGDNVDPDAYNRTMQPLLPQALKDVIDVAYGTIGKERTERALRFTKWQAEHPIFTIFSKEAPGLRDARFAKIMLLGPTTRVDDRQILARYTNGATAFMEGRIGQGRLMLYTSTLDRDWNDLVIHPGFLPLMQQAVRYLARKQDERAREVIYVGHSTVLALGADDSRLEVRAPDGTRTVMEGERLRDRKYIRFADTTKPGFYRVLGMSTSGATLRRVEADFAVNLDPRGSDLRPVDPSVLPRSGQGSAGADRVAHTRRVELWHAVAIGLLLLLLVESVLVLR